eukprot:jgi/Tetstr1/459966/TSEL_005290.t1
MDLFTPAWAKDTGETYGSAIKPFFRFCKEHGSMQPYRSAIIGFYHDHGVEPVARGDLIAKMRKGLAASPVEKEPPGVRTYAPANRLMV